MSEDEIEGNVKHDDQSLEEEFVICEPEEGPILGEEDHMEEIEDENLVEYMNLM
ncbi:hypothetical protein KI387_039687, partial [Taxus chinensis]